MRPPSPSLPRKGGGGNTDAGDERKVCVGRILGAHGVRGEVRLEGFTEFADDVAAYGKLTDDAGRTYEIESLRDGPRGMIATLAGIDDRDQADALRGVRLYVPRSRLPPLEEEDEFYQADLIGLAAVRSDGAALGKVIAVQNFGAGDLLEIAMPGMASSVFVPFTKAIVPKIDMAAGTLVIAPPPGLLDPATPEDEGEADG